MFISAQPPGNKQCWSWNIEQVAYFGEIILTSMFLKDESNIKYQYAL
jgi:hypothetical protein